MVKPETYKQVYAMMDACNLSGIIYNLPAIYEEIWKEARELGEGTAYVNEHPVSIAITDKFVQLTKHYKDAFQVYAIIREKAGL